MKLSYTHPELPTQQIWLAGNREGAPIFLDPYMYVWGLKKIRDYYAFESDYRDGYWLCTGDRVEFKVDIRVFGYAVLEYFLDRKHFSEYLRRWAAVKRRTLRAWDDATQSGMKKQSDAGLIDSIRSGQALLIDIWGVSPLAAMIGDMASEWTDWWLEGKGLSGEEKKQSFPPLFYTDRTTETMKRQKAIQRLLAENSGNRHIMDTIIRKYGYAKSNFGGYHPYMEADVRQDAESLGKVALTDDSLQKKALLQTLNVTGIEKRIFDIFGYCQYSRDERMAYEQRMFAVIDWSIRELSERYGIPHVYLKQMLVEEVSLENLADANYINTLKQRCEGLLMYWKDGDIGAYGVGSDARKIFDSVGDAKQENVRELMVQTVLYGHVEGRVRVITSPDMAVPQEPFVLVVSMTSPDFVRFLSGCVAIITDEGGITCHAAILARELRKPCIIGMKVATQVLRDGDLVDVDADTGSVRILERPEVVA